MVEKAKFTITQRVGKKLRGTLVWPAKNLTATVVSGDSGHDGIPTGAWTGRLFIDQPNGDGYRDAQGNAWFFVFEDQQGRTDMGIHPDGGVADATLGCIGIRDADTSAWEVAFRSLSSPSQFSCMVEALPSILDRGDDGLLETSPAPIVPTGASSLVRTESAQDVVGSLSTVIARSLQALTAHGSSGIPLFPNGVTKIEVKLTLPDSAGAKLLIQGPDNLSGEARGANMVSSRSLTNGELGCDTSTSTTAHIGCLKGKVTFVARYLARGSGAKVLTNQEALALTNSGIRIVSVWESGKPTASAYFTKAQGTADGKDAYQLAERIGQPKGTPIYFAVDYDATEGEVNGPITHYFDGVGLGLADAQALSSGSYGIGVYGSGRTCRLLISSNRSSWSWLAQSAGWAEHGTYTGWWIKQTGKNTLCGLEIDGDIAVGDYGGYLVGAAFSRSD